MNKEEKTEYLIDQLRAENAGYEALSMPVDLPGKRRLL